MLKTLKKLFHSIFKRNKVKPVLHPKEIEIVCQGFYAAPDVMCVKTDGYKQKRTD